jgi:hypothetical protein
MKVIVEPSLLQRGSYRVRLTQNNQTFYLGVERDQEDARFVAKMFRHALKAHTDKAISKAMGDR